MAKRQRKLYEKKHDDHDSDPNADVESNTWHAALSTNADASFVAPVRLHFHHTRNRLADLDGLSVKAAIDGLVAAGILADDSPKHVAEITHTQSKGDPEVTTITITEI